MGSKVFVSCGQATDEERAVATGVLEWLQSEGYDPYVAIEAQTILDINRGIIEELKSSDLYLFINFRRERLCKESARLPSQIWNKLLESLGAEPKYHGHIYRGSLFSNQELAIAYALGFDRVLVLSQRGVRREGMLAFMASNTPEFEGYEDVNQVLQEAVEKASWRPLYSRHLVPVRLFWSAEEVSYADHTSHRHGRILYGLYAVRQIWTPGGKCFR